MTHLMLSCPRCHKPLVYVPLDGFTLHYRCPDHGALILRPLVEVEPDDGEPFAPGPDQPQLGIRDAA